MFDLTKKIRLHGAMQKRYNAARMLLHVIFLIAILFVMYRILFPIIPLDFAMDTPNSTKNTLVSPRIAQTGQFPVKKSIPTSDTFIFNANPTGQFSEANVSFTLEKNSSSIENSTVKIRKSYRAFFYPTGNPANFKDSSLLSTPDGSYYIVSDGLLRKFSNTDIILALGYPKSAFVEVLTEDLKFNKTGEEINSTDNYPNNTLFSINGNFYQLQNQHLVPFISAQAYLSQFDPTMAVAKNADLLSRYPVSEEYLGFRDGTLASSAESVYILSKGKSYPIKSAETFLALGFAWENIIPVNTEELSIYKKQKQFTNDDSHPEGMTFVDQKTNAYFVIENGEKLPLLSDAVVKNYSKQKPVLANLSGAEKELSCKLKKRFFSSNTYKCSVSLEELTGLLGNDYQISATFSANATISTINTTFSTPFTFKSLKNSLSIIKTRVQNR